jgi:hypothetical protein
MTIQRLALAFCFVSCATTNSNTSGSSTAAPLMAEMEALLKQESYEELLSKAGNAPATERNDAWLNLVSQAAIKSTPKKEFKEAYEAEAYLQNWENLISRYPTLKTSKEFMAHRAENGKSAFLWTYSNYRHSTGDEQWVPKILDFVKVDTLTAGIVQKYANEAVIERLVASSAFPLFQLAFERDGDKVCQDKGLPKTIVDMIDYDIWIPETQKLFARCGTAFDAAVSEKLKDATAKDFKRHACVTLKDKPVMAGVCK